MNRLIKAVIFSFSTALVAAPAFAAPQDQRNNAEHATQNHNDAPNHNDAHKDASNHHADEHKPAPQAAQQPGQQKPNHDKAPRPSASWKPGNPVPTQYRGQGYKVDHKKFKKLSKPGKNQQWIKVNGDYILMNVVNDKVIKIIAA